jgi:hypothetical protein
MGADFVLHRTWRPKLEAGRGDIHDGTFRLLGMLKVRNRAGTISAMVQREGKNPETAPVKVVVLGPNGPEERDVNSTRGRRREGLLKQEPSINRSNDRPNVGHDLRATSGHRLARGGGERR